jgi:hypothetical protein
MPHRQRGIRFAVENSRDESDRAPRNQLAHEHDSAPPFLRALSPDIEPQVHFLEIAMKRDRETDDARVEEHKTDNAEERLAVVEIEFRVNRDQRLKDLRVDGEVQHRQVTPVRGEKRFQHQGAGVC